MRFINAVEARTRRRRRAEVVAIAPQRSIPGGIPLYQISRAIYRELTPHIVPGGGQDGAPTNHERVLKSCELAVERLATDRRYFARPTRTLFTDVRCYFSMADQQRVFRIVDRYLNLADAWLSRLPEQGLDAFGNRLQCRATTRKGTACQRVPLARNGYCPSHQHLAETEDDLHRMPTAA